MNFELSVFLSLTIGIAAIAGFIRMKKIDTSYFPFIILTVAAFINEGLSILVAKAGYSNAALNNIFSVLELYLIMWQFYKWSLFEGKKKIVYSVLAILTTIWIVELSTINWRQQFNSYFLTILSTTVVLLSINMINKVLFREPTRLYKNSIFLICIGFVIYFTYSILVEVFWFYGLNKSKWFRIDIYEILAWVNLITNVIYTIAIIWIPMKRQYIMQS